MTTCKKRTAFTTYTERQSLLSYSLLGLGFTFFTFTLVPIRAHFLLSSSFIEFQIVEFEHVSNSILAQVLWVLAQVIRVFQIFSNSSLVEIEFWGLKPVKYSCISEISKVIFSWFLSLLASCVNFQRYNFIITLLPLAIAPYRTWLTTKNVDHCA